MLGRRARRWILLTLLTACGEQGYAVLRADDGQLVDDGASTSRGARAGEAIPEVSGSESRVTEAALGRVATPCSAADCSAVSLDFSPNDPYRQRRVIRGDTRDAGNARSRADCAGLGQDVLYELDLSAFSEPVRANFHVRADFDASLAIETGRRDDPFLTACNEDHAPGADEAFLSLTLEPKLYRIVVDGERAGASGELELTVELPSPTGRCGAPPPNDRCEHAIPLDTHRAAQTVLGTTECASDHAQANWECDDFPERAEDVFYSLDLTDRTEPVLIHATTRLAPTDHDTVLFLTRDVLGECAEPLICGDDDWPDELRAELWANLEPGRYLLGVQSYEASGDFGLEVEIAAEPCVVANDTCETAQVIEPRLGAQTLLAWPGCGDDSFTSLCNSIAPSPDIFYRLDLREFERPVRVRVEALRGGEEFDALSLMTDGAGTCGEPLLCGSFDLWLAPESYYFALDGYRDQQGPVELTVAIDMAPPPPPADCIDERISTCARTDREWCCAGDGGDCAMVLESCGLRPEALSCMCAADPNCCEGRGASYECQRFLGECGTFCPGFDPVLSCPG